METVQAVNPPGPETVWAILREVAESQKETDRIFKENARKAEERSERIDRELKETDRILKENARKAEERSERIDRKMEMLNEQMGGLHNSFGEMAEHLVAPSIAERFNELGFHFSAAAPGGFKVFDGNGKVITQVDILMLNSSCIMAVEIKATVHTKDVEHHVKRLELLRQYWDKNGDRRVIQGAIAGAIFGSVEKKAAIEAGLYVLVQSGDTMKLELPDGFIPRTW